MTVYVHLLYLVVENVGALSEEVIDYVVDEKVITRDWRRRHNYRVARDYLQVFVLLIRHPSQGRGRLSLSTGDDDNHLLMGQCPAVAPD